MNILGINCFSHDTSAALVQDGKLVAFVEEERLNREKHTKAFPEQAIAFCLSEGDIEMKDVNHVAFTFRPGLDFMRAVRALARYFPFSVKKFGVQTAIDAFLFFKTNDFKKRAKFKGKTHFVGHHEAHCASSFLVSPFERAPILSIDRGGDYISTMLALGEGAEIKTLQVTRNPHSVGSVYSAITEFLGFRANSDEGKVMGLAPYGEDVYRREFEDMIQLTPKGFRIDLNYFSYHVSDAWVSKKFTSRFGAPRAPESSIHSREERLAATLQKRTEEVGLHLAKRLYDLTNRRSLCITGGVALNSVMNSAILNDGPFEDVYVQPAANDAGTAIGAAFYVWNHKLGNGRRFEMKHALWGPGFDTDQARAFLIHAKLDFETVEDQAQRAAELLSRGNIVGWFQGRMEAGPRALGNRSILADPRDPEMKDIVNREVKHREGFRPYAPSVLAEDAPDWFDDYSPSPFMLKVLPIKADKRQVIPAVTHVDGTGRIQTVARQDNPLYYELISSFKELTGVPVVLNTSFNVRGQPIVLTPEHAVKMFCSTGMDALFIDNLLLLKESVRKQEAELAAEMARKAATEKTAAIEKAAASGDRAETAPEAAGAPGQ